jgi:hypothetical protein
MQSWTWGAPVPREYRTSWVVNSFLTPDFKPQIFRSKKLEMENKQQQKALDTLQTETEQKISNISNEFKSKVNTN